MFHHHHRLLQKIKEDTKHYNAARKHAESILRDKGFNDTNEDFVFYVELETRQWLQQENYQQEQDELDRFFGIDE